MTRLDTWLAQATRRLSKDSAAQVRAEIREHYESALEASMQAGASAQDADQSAVAALGDATAANRQYRKVLLTAAEANLVRDAKWESRAFCSRPWLKWTLLAIPLAALLAAALLFAAGAAVFARVAFAFGMVTSLLFAAPFLPVYTPARGRIFRGVKWIVLLTLLLLVSGSHALNWSWLLWPAAWTEWMRVSIRRKLPMAQWPKSLYL